MGIAIIEVVNLVFYANKPNSEKQAVTFWFYLEHRLGEASNAVSWEGQWYDRNQKCSSILILFMWCILNHCVMRNQFTAQLTTSPAPIRRGCTRIKYGHERGVWPQFFFPKHHFDYGIQRLYFFSSRFHVIHNLDAMQLPTMFAGCYHE